MGGPGSGRAIDDNKGGAAKKDRTPATEKHLTDRKKQRGDRLFRAVKVFSNGEKVDCGLIPDTRIDTVGKRFGPGEFELHEVDRSTEQDLGNVVRRSLHPSSYAPVADYEKTPSECEMEREAKRRAELNRQQQEAAAISAGIGGSQVPGAPLLENMSPAAIYQKAVEDVTKQLRQEQETNSLKMQVESMAKKIDSLLNNPPQQQGSALTQAEMFFDLYKKMTPPPQPIAPATNQSPAEQMLGMVELIKSFKAISKDLTSSLTAGATKIPNESPILGRILDQLGTIAEIAVEKWDPHGDAMKEAAGAAASRRVSPSAVKEKDEPMPTENEIEATITALAREVHAHQLQQLAKPPQGHISETAKWITDQWNAPDATMFFRNLRATVAGYPGAALQQYLGEHCPELIDTDEKRNWTAALIDLLKQDAGD